MILGFFFFFFWRKFSFEKADHRRLFYRDIRVAHIETQDIGEIFRGLRFSKEPTANFLGEKGDFLKDTSGTFLEDTTKRVATSWFERF